MWLIVSKSFQVTNLSDIQKIKQAFPWTNCIWHFPTSTNTNLFMTAFSLLSHQEITQKSSVPSKTVSNFGETLNASGLLLLLQLQNCQRRMTTPWWTSAGQPASSGSNGLGLDVWEKVIPELCVRVGGEVTLWSVVVFFEWDASSGRSWALGWDWKRGFYKNKFLFFKCTIFYSKCQTNL